jgi:tetratricopeptide (TPR) repeat protein
MPKPFSLDLLLLLIMKFANKLAATCNRVSTMMRSRLMMGPWFSKGLALAKKYDEAIKACDETIRLDPNHALAWYAKGIVLEALGRTSEAKAAKVKAKELGYSG